MGNPIVHFELWSREPKKVADFYSEVFDWSVNYTDQLSYWLIDTLSGSGINGGMFEPQEGALPAKLAFYVQVDDVEAAIEKATAAGAKVLVPATEIPQVGWSAILLDPEERAFGLFKPMADGS